MLIKPGLLSAEDVIINDIPLNTIDDNSVAWIVTDIDGWWGLPDVEVPDDVRPYSQDGSYYTTGRFTARTINLKGYILPTDGVSNKAVASRNAFNRALVLVRQRAQLKVREEGIVKVSLVQISARPMLRISQATGLLEFDIQLKATDPLKYGDYVNTYISILNAGSTGRVYNRGFDFSYGGEQQFNHIDIYSNSTYPTWPEFLVTGPIVDPIVGTLQFNTTLGVGQELRVVPATGEVSLQGENRINTMTKNSRWTPIYPGENQIMFAGTQQIATREHLSVQTNNAVNPVPMDGLAAPTSGTTVRENYVRNPKAAGAASGSSIPNLATFGAGTGGSGITMTSDSPLTTATMRTNYSQNPVAGTATTGWTYTAGTTEAGTSTRMTTGANLTTETGEQITTYMRRSITTAKTAGTSTWAYISNVGSISIPASGSIVGSIYARVSTAVTEARIVLYDRAAGVDGTPTVGPWIPMSANAWTRFNITDIAAVASDAYHIRIQLNSTLPIGATFDITGNLLELGTILNPYFSGASPARDFTGDVRHAQAWTGTTHASTSRQYLTISPTGTGPVSQGGPSSFGRHIVTVAKTSGSSGWNASTIRPTMVGVAGEFISISAWLRYNGPAGPDTERQIRFRTTLYSGATPLAPVAETDLITLPVGIWKKVSMSIQAPSAFDSVSFWEYQVAGFTMPVWSSMDITGVLVERVADQKNIMANPSFETGTDYIIGNAATTSISATWAAEGTSSLKITPTGASTDSFAAINSTVYSQLTPGKYYEFIGINHTPAEEIGTVSPYFNGMRVLWSGGEAASLTPPLTAGERQVSLKFALPAAATFMRLYNGSLVNDSFWDKVSITESSPNLAVRRRNIITDPRATQATLWSASAGTGGVVSETMVTGAVDGPTLPGGGSSTTYARYTYTTANSGGTALFGTNIGGLNLLQQYTEETPIGAGIYVRCSQARTWGLGVATSLDGVVNTPQDTANVAVVAANTWTRIGTVLDSAGAAFDAAAVYAELISSPGTVGMTVDVTCAFVEPGAEALHPHFDGALTNSTDGLVGWESTVNNSPSFFDPALQDSYVVDVDDPEVPFYGYFDGDSVSTTGYDYVWNGPSEISTSSRVRKYFDGSQTSTKRNTANKWSGTVNNSSSQMYLPLRGWDAVNTSLFQSYNETTIVRRPGTKSIKVTRLEGFPEDARIAELTHIGSSSGAVSALPVAIANSSMGASVYVQTDAATAYATLRMTYYTNTDAVIREAFSPVYTINEDEWVRVVLVDPIPAPFNAVRVGISSTVSVPTSDGSQISASAWFQDAKIGLATFADEAYFDGTYVNALWNGTAHNSTSSVLVEVDEVKPPTLTVYTRDAWIE